MVTDTGTSAAQPTWFTQALGAHPIMGILRGYPTDRTLQLAARAWDFGARLVEVPIQSAAALHTLAALAATDREPDQFVGAGTVVNVRQVADAAAAGACFVVSPGLDPAVVEAAASHGLAALPGAATGSEIQLALRLNLRWIKAFPASVLGPDWFKAMHGPFPQVSFVATGGIDADNAAHYLAAGARVLGVGSALGEDAQLAKLTELPVAVTTDGPDV